MPARIAAMIRGRLLPLAALSLIDAEGVAAAEGGESLPADDVAVTPFTSPLPRGAPSPEAEPPVDEASAVVDCSAGGLWARLTSLSSAGLLGAPPPAGCDP